MSWRRLVGWRRLDGEWQAALAGLAVAVIGWWIHSVLFATIGTLAAVTGATLWVWQRHCLTGVHYRRRLGERRANFGEEVSLEVELVNDKLLPLTWLHVADEVPAALAIRGGTVEASSFGGPGRLHHLLPMLPYQRVRRRMTVVCDRRGLHAFGPAQVSSGNPAGYREERRGVADVDQLLVYPKVFQLAAVSPASRVPLGDHRSPLRLIADPSRVVGVRDYQPGDPLRHIDWRATARSPSLLVRVFEPTTSLRTAVFVDLRMPGGSVLRRGTQLEFAVAVAASVVSDLAGRGVAVGLYATAYAGGHGVARPPSGSPAALPEMLELLARAVETGRITVADLLLREAARLQQGTSLIVISPDFAGGTLVALAELRRRHAITAVWVATGAGAPPPDDLVDVAWEARYCDEWTSLATLELAGQR